MVTQSALRVRGASVETLPAFRFSPRSSPRFSPRFSSSLPWRISHWRPARQMIFKPLAVRPTCLSSPCPRLPLPAPLRSFSSTTSSPSPPCSSSAPPSSVSPPALPPLSPASPAPASLPACSAPLPFIAHGRSMPGQRLLPCSPEDVAVLSASSLRFPNPQEVEGGVIVRLVRRSDPVTSPVLRSVRNRQYGIRGSERWWLLGSGALASACLLALGFWQLARMQWKHQLIEYRRAQMRKPAVWVTRGPFPWTVSSEDHRCTGDGSSDSTQERPETRKEGARAEARRCDAEAKNLSPLPSTNSDSSSPAHSPSSSPPSSSCSSSSCSSSSSVAVVEKSSFEREEELRAAWAYRPVIARGVLDSSTELRVGPRPGLEPGTTGYLLVSPLRLEDGNVLLVNKGHLQTEDAKLPPFRRPETRREGAWRTREVNLAQGRSALADACSGSTPGGGWEASAAARDAFARNSGCSLDAKTRDEPPGWVTVRGILEPGEIPSSTCQCLLAGNRPKDAQFIFLVPADLVEGLRPGTVPHKAATGAMILNAYDIVYDEDVRAAKRSRERKEGEVGADAGESRDRRAEQRSQGRGAKGEEEDGSRGEKDVPAKEEREASRERMSTLASLPRSLAAELGAEDPSSFAALLGLAEIPKRFAKYQQKRKDDYLLFWADEHTHFNYACQWFVMALCTASMTLYKFVQVSRWRW
ncbi:SURF1 family protein [Toxoplasma gondii p89]|uniref:SURF1-like protein n=1 Tax=Toxoplasma gondii p89 TaxID=943119 RepID=A0A086K9N0_TOXGO|nr:SURF1 family protein [Toxoplasma gondii p89]